MSSRRIIIGEPDTLSDNVTRWVMVDAIGWTDVTPEYIRDMQPLSKGELRINGELIEFFECVPSEFPDA